MSKIRPLIPLPVLLLIVAFAVAGAVMGAFLTGCTENQRAREFGGTATVELKPGERLVNATWKEHDLWYLVRHRRADEPPATYEFREDSSYGVMNGTVVFLER